MSYLEHGKNFVEQAKQRVIEAEKTIKQYCSKCKGEMIHILELAQDRSADEGITTYTTCTKCQKTTKKNT